MYHCIHNPPSPSIDSSTAPRPCRALLLTTPGTKALLPLLLPQPQPNQPQNDDFYDTQLLLGSILLPGVSLAGNRATSVSHPANLGCFLYSVSSASAAENGEGAGRQAAPCAPSHDIPYWLTPCNAIYLTDDAGEGGAWDPDAVVVCACNAEVPVEVRAAVL